jgi:opacity protein-like surface antigen
VRMLMNYKSQIHGTMTRMITFTMRSAMLCALVCVVAGAARAQAQGGQGAAEVAPRFEASGAFSYMRGNADDSGGGFNLDGGSGSFAYDYKDWLSFVGDVGAYHFTDLGGGLSSTMYTYLAGPRLPLRRKHRLKPFVQVLLGAGRLNANSAGIHAGENSFATAIGGGLDFTIRRRLEIRVIEADYLLTRFAHPDGSSATQNNVRISAGFVFRFGSR